MKTPPPRTYQSITIHPSSDPSDTYQEVWAEWVEELRGKTFDTDGIIGWIYPVPYHGERLFVWMNDCGYPAQIFSDGELKGWLSYVAPKVVWATEARM